MKEILRACQKRLLRFYLLILLAILLVGLPCFLWMRQQERTWGSAPLLPLTAQALESHADGQFQLQVDALPDPVLEVSSRGRVRESYHVLEFEGKLLILGLNQGEKDLSPAQRLLEEPGHQVEGWVRTIHHEVLSRAMEATGQPAGAFYPFLLEEHTAAQEIAFARRVFWIPFGGALALWGCVALYNLLLVRLRVEFARHVPTGEDWDRFAAGYRQCGMGQKGARFGVGQGWLFLQSADRFMAVNLREVYGAEARSLGRSRPGWLGGRQAETMLKLYRPDKHILNIDLGRGNYAPLMAQLFTGCPWLTSMQEDENRDDFKSATPEQLRRQLEARLGGQAAAESTGQAGPASQQPRQ